MRTVKKSKSSSLYLRVLVPCLWLTFFLPSLSLAQTTRPTDIVPTGANRVPHPAPVPGKTLELSIEQLGNFDYDAEKDTPIPADVKALSGCTVRLSGFMVPLDQADDITQFALVPTLNGGDHNPPLIQDTIVVNCPKNKPAHYNPDRITIEGKLTVKVVKDDGFVVSIFTVDCTSVKPAEGK